MQRIDEGDHETPAIASSESTLGARASTETGRENVVSRRTRRRVTREERIGIDRFLKDEKRVVISGDAGMGKTTLLRALALDCLSPSPKILLSQNLTRHVVPIWLPFALWTRMAATRGVPPSLHEVVRTFFESHNEPELAEQLVAAVHRGQIMLLVDGIDEAIDEEAARTVSAVLATFVSSRDISVVATSRPHGNALIGGFPASWALAELAPLSAEQRNQLAAVWFGVLAAAEGISAVPEQEKLGRSRAEALAQALKRNPGIGRLAQTPLFLLAMLQLHRHNQQLPRSRFAVIEKISEQLVEHQPQRRATASLNTAPSELPHRNRDRVLADFAFALHSGELQGPIHDAALEDQAVARAVTLLLHRQPSIGEVEARACL